jgi:hypothetical protein
VNVYQFCSCLSFVLENIHCSNTGCCGVWEDGQGPLLYNPSLWTAESSQNSAVCSSSIQDGAENFSAPQCGADENKVGLVLFPGYGLH